MNEKQRESSEEPVDDAAASTSVSASDAAAASAARSAPDAGSSEPAMTASAAQPDRTGETRPGRQAPSWLALVFSLLALGLASWLVYERIQLEPQVAEQPAAAEDLRALQLRLDELSTGLATESEQRQHSATQQSARAGEFEAVAERLQQGLGDLEQQLAPLSNRLDRQSAELSDELAALATELGRAVDDWSERGDLERQAERDLQRQIGLLEAAALLRIGQERAELAGDLEAARWAFRRAAEQLGRIDDVRLDRARRALARELEALEAVRSPDTVQALARLERLTRDSRAWPTQLGEPAQGDGGREAADAAGEAEDRHWRERLAGVARGLVRVQARDEVGRTAEQFDAARELMQLRLVAAQLALTRRDAEGLSLHVQAAIELLDDWFDSADAGVGQARADLDALASFGLERTLPELGEALNLLQSRLSES